MAEERSCFAGLYPQHRVPKLKNETRLKLARELALRQHDKSPIVLNACHIVHRREYSQSAGAGAALRVKHMWKEQFDCAPEKQNAGMIFIIPASWLHWEESYSFEDQAFLRFFCR
jgi:hypothetical protein